MPLSSAVSLVLATIVLSGALTPAAAAPAVFVAAELGVQETRPRDADFDRPFEAPLPARVTENGEKRVVPLANCREYLAIRGRIVGSDTDANYRVLRLQTVPCAALALLKSATTATRTALPPDFLHETATAHYPATLWPAVSDDERRKLARPSSTLRTASGKATFHVVKSEALAVEAAGFGLHLTLLARGDFDHDGWEDAAFRWEAYALKGSYTDARLVVLTRGSADKTLRELPLDQLLANP